MAKQISSYDKGHLAEHLKKVYEFTWTGSHVPEGCHNYTIIGGRGTGFKFTSDKGTFEGVMSEGSGPTLVVFNDGKDALHSFVEEALKDEEVRDLVGPDALEKQLQTVLQSTNGLLPNGDLREFIRFQIMKPLRDELQVWISFVPVVNLVVTMPFRIGDVEFISQGKASVETKQFIEDHRFGGDNDVHKEQQKRAILSKVEECCQQCRGFARVSVRAHSKRVKDVASDKALIAINILRSCTHLFHSYSEKAWFGLCSEMATGVSNMVSLGQTEEHRFYIDSEVGGPRTEFVLDAQKIEHLTSKCHFANIQYIIDKSFEQRDSLETAIVQGFQALGRAIVAPTIDMRFLGCTIALERLLIRDGEETTTERWSDRLAVILGHDPEKRQAIIQRAKKLYDLRSRIVHAAYSGVADADARTMERWAVGVIVSTLARHKEFSSHEEFCKRIDPREIGLSIEPKR